ncbi:MULTISPECIES: putative Ig domain-containing protein [unclassified Microbacterium]|uniref:putative Ig domain-containing protein n=1 Tax=unclassified Microbacterium TaxID=2609290 RepID=UPI002882DCFD|nr:MULTISPECIES: putative Ig domain-containing protein [unclassified Microbacterium]
MKAQGLPFAVVEDGYSVLMHVTGDFDLSDAVWTLEQGELPTGLAVDKATGTISGIPTSSPGKYLFQLAVVNEKTTVRGWFYIWLQAATEPNPSPEPGDGTDEPGFPPGGGVDPTDPVDPHPGDGGSETDPGDDGTPGGEGPTDPVDPTDPTAPVDPVDPTDPSQPGDGGSDGGTGTDPTDPSEPAEPGDGGTAEPDDPTDPDPVDPGTETPTEPGDGSEVDPEDPTIDPGAGGAKPDVLTFPVPATVAVQVGGVVDLDLIATSTLGLEISYEATGLPSWLSFTEGRLVGTAPSAAGSFTITLTATNAKNSETQRTTVIVSPGRTEIDAAAFDLVVGESKSIELNATNGSSNANFVYSLVKQVAGVTLEGNVLTATATTAGSFDFEILVHDTNAPTGGRATFTIPFTVAPKPIVFVAGTRTLTQYVAYSSAFSASEGWGRYSYRVVDGALPAGLQLNVNGTLSGSVASTGTFTATIQVTDAEGLSAKDELTIVVRPNPAITPSGAIEVTQSTAAPAVSPDGNTLYVPSGKVLNVIDVDTSTIRSQVPITVTSVLSTKISPDGSRLVLVSESVAQIFDTSTMTVVGSVTARDLIDATWSLDGTDLYLVRTGASTYAQFLVVNATSWETVSTLRLGATGRYWKLQTLSSGLVLANSSGSATSYEIDPAGQKARAFYSARAATLMVDAGDGTVWMANGPLLQRVDVASGTLLASTNMGQSASVTAIALSPDGRWIYHLGLGEIRVYDVEEDLVIARVPVDANQSAKLAISPDGTKVYVSSGSTYSTVIVLTPAAS